MAKKEKEIKEENVPVTEPIPNTENSNKEVEKLNNEILKLREENNRLNELINELDNKVKLAQAELVNYRKRKDEETANLLKFANQDLIVDIVPVLDNFERAVNTDESKLDEKTAKYLQGFKLLATNFKDALTKYGVEEIPTVGQTFDPMVHEALMTKSDSGQPDEIVLECLMKGYTLKGKVIRPAKVIVNKLD